MIFFNVPFTGDPAFDFFFSIIASASVSLYLLTLVFALFRGRI